MKCTPFGICGPTASMTACLTEPTSVTVAPGFRCGAIVAATSPMAPTGTDFNSGLVREYKQLTIFEADEMYDWIDAENHATKGVMAANGQTPMPSDPAEWAIEDPAKLQELELGRSSMMALFNKGARTVAPLEAAHAQAKYDCWVEQQEEGHQPMHIAACKGEFESALAGLRTATEPKKVEATPKETEMDVVSVVEEVARETVYFPFDQAVIEPTEQAKLDKFVAEMKNIQPVVTLYIEGHADTSGPADYNLALSASRADSVRTELMRQGMTIGDYEQLQVENLLALRPLEDGELGLPLELVEARRGGGSAIAKALRTVSALHQ